MSQFLQLPYDFTGETEHLLAKKKKKKNNEKLRDRKVTTCMIDSFADIQAPHHTCIVYIILCIVFMRCWRPRHHNYACAPMPRIHMETAV